MIKNKLIPTLLLITASANRAITKLNESGGIFEATLILAVMLKPYTILSLLRKYTSAFLLIAYTLTILAIESFEYGMSVLSIRRAMLGFYAITPLILLAYKDEICAFVANKITYMAAILLAIAVANLPSFQPTMAAQLAGGLFIFSIIYKKSTISIFLVGAAYLLLVSGQTSGQSVYRTPLVTVFFAILILYISNFNIRGIKLNILLKVISGAIVAIVFIISGALNKPIGSVLIGVSGLTSSETMYKAGVSLGGDTNSSRGDAAGTSETRKIFWVSIIEYQLNDVKSLVFGYGFQNGFMEVALPEMPFKDKELIDPHNSYINIFFRFGLIGVFLYAILFARISIHLISVCGRKNAFPFMCIAYLFAFFEVALENPHGNLIFWSILLMPLLLEKNAPFKIKPDKDIVYA